MPRRSRIFVWSIPAALLGLACSPAGRPAPRLAEPAVAAPLETVSLPATRDVTLLESATGARANGEGSGFFAGRTRQPRDSRRRALVAFDVAGSIPAGADVVSAELSLTIVHTRAGDEPLALYRVLADWGEGPSKTDGGKGAPSMPGDATWIHTFFPDRLWSRPGGDHAAAPSAVVTAGAEGVYTWGPTAGMTADVAHWLDDPEKNFGWLLAGNEDAPATAKHFASREFEEPAARPRLSVTFRRRAGGGAP